MRDALETFLVLADRCLTAEQRGTSSATAKEFETFWEVSNQLAEVMELLPQDGPPSRRTFSREQYRLGALREKFNSLLGSVSRVLEGGALEREDLSNKADKELANVLAQACHHVMPELEATPAIVFEAIVALKKRLGVDEFDNWPVLKELSNPPKGKSRNKPSHGAGTAGLLLEEVIDRCSYEPSIGYKTSSTASFAKTVRDYDAVFKARDVPRNEQLTLLAVLLGVPLREAAWTAFRMRLLLQGKDLSDLREPGWEDNWDLREPETFRLLNPEEWSSQLKTIRQKLVDAGRPDDPDAWFRAFMLSASHLRPARTDKAKPLKEKPKVFGRGIDPWNRDRSTREATREVRHLIDADPAVLKRGTLMDLAIEYASSESLDKPDIMVDAIHVLGDAAEVLGIEVESTIEEDSQLGPPDS